MDILFTKSNSPVSKLILKVTGEPVSHCVIRVGEFVIHSNLLGVRIDPYRKFIKKNKVVHKLTTLTNNEKIFKTLDKYHGKPYDFLGLLFLGLRYLCPTLIPKRNLWQVTGMFMCTEFVTETLDGEEDSYITPYQLYLKLLAQD